MPETRRQIDPFGKGMVSCFCPDRGRFHVIYDVGGCPVAAPARDAPLGPLASRPAPLHGRNAGPLRRVKLRRLSAVDGAPMFAIADDFLFDLGQEEVDADEIGKTHREHHPVGKVNHRSE